MPAPKFLAGLPKPLLFALYGAAGGLLGALVFAEPLYRLLTPPPPAAATAQVSIAASTAVEVFVSGQNTFAVQIARDGFDGPVAVRVGGLPAGVRAEPVVIPAGKSEGEIVLIGSPDAGVVAAHQADVIAEGGPDGKTATAETHITVKVTNPPKALADIVFVLDVTNSMQWAIDDLKNGIGQFAGALGKARIDFRLGLVTFQDITNAGEKVDVVEFKDGPFTADAETFRAAVSRLRAAGGGDIPESSLDAMTAACRLPFRKEATKVLLLITDAPPKVPGNNPTQPVRTLVQRIKTTNIDAVHTVVHRLDADVYEPLVRAGAEKGGGRYFNLGEVVAGDDGFNGLLSTFGSAVSAAAIAKNPDTRPQVAARAAKPELKALQSGERAAAGSEGKLVLRSGAWTAAIAALICLFLVGGQHYYLRGTRPAAGGTGAALLGGLAVGLVGGAAGQGLFFLAPDSAFLATAFRVFSWALLGGLAGPGLSLFIPNMKWTLGLAGGAVGGAAGAIGFIVVSSATGDLVGRLVGGLVLGFFIGLMVAIAETAFRRAWLEVRFGERETITVTLGPEPVKVGSDARACTVWARGAAAVALRFFVRDGKVICDDTVMGRESVVADGFAKEVGTLTVTVRTGSGAATSPVPPPRPKAAPAAKPAPLSLDDDDDLNLPMPVASRPPALARPPTPPATKPVIPTVAPAIKAAVKNPNACPTCGRVVAGTPGQRYCMICDQTY